MRAEAEQIYDRVMARCARESYAGRDPFDGLGSRIFKALPFRRSSIARLGWLQVIKRFPLDLRPLLLVPAGVNAKALALFCIGETARYRANGSSASLDNAVEIGDRLLTLGSRNAEKLTFGYNFDWQSSVFYAPKGTPTIVPTAFAARAFLALNNARPDEKYLEAVRRICRFIAADLNRTVETDDEICFSYTPVDRSEIYNASLLAAEQLAAIARIDSRDDYRDLAIRGVNFVVNGQQPDGSWRYGPGERHGWIDNFHTAYILDSLIRIADDLPDVRESVHGAVERGSEFWTRSHFLDNGTPKYFHDRVYPIDIHSAAVAVATLSSFARKFPTALPLAEKVLRWTIDNLFDGRDSFYYQRRRSFTTKTRYMRWGQAWMCCALAAYLEAAKAENGG